jgi:RNA polymerase sigma-B factor
MDDVGFAAERDQRELWRRCGEGDRRAREALVDIYLPLARRMARRYAGVREPYDDLVQVASLGLLNAIDRFDPTAGTPFPGFARPTILGELKRHLRDRVWSVRVPRPLHDLMGKIETVTEELTRAAGRPPSVGEIATRLGVEPGDVLEALEADHNRRAVSLDASVDEEGEGAPQVESMAVEERGYAAVEDRAIVSALLPQVDDAGRELLRMRFVDDLSQRQIAARIGRSQMYVSRRLRDSLERMREGGGGTEALAG